MYTKGMGSGHLTRINAVYKGFVRAGIACDFFASAHRSKYRKYLEPGIIVCDRATFPEELDLFICDWRSDEFTDQLPRRMAKCWIGLRRLGTTRSTFPDHYHLVAIEPNVRGHCCLWPVINTWPDELLTREELTDLLDVEPEMRIGILCENGAYPKHIAKVFYQELPDDVRMFKCSNSEYAVGNRDLDYYPVSRLFGAVDFLVIGGGYNSVHEALSYADLSKTRMVNVGGDDQAIRLKKSKNWETRRGSQAHILAEYLVDKMSRFS